MDLFTVQDPARELGISADRVRQLERAGLIPCFRTPSGLRLFRPADVRKLAEQRMKQDSRFGSHRKRSGNAGINSNSE